jgi:hypothetical protein
MEAPGYVNVHTHDDAISGSKQCRICLEEDRPEDMIAPCRCKGTQKYVHRDCLDKWRYTREDRAFRQSLPLSLSPSLPLSLPLALPLSLS